MTEAFDTIVSNMLSPDHWPFWAVALVFAVIGEFTSKSLFTRERAYCAGCSWWRREVWYWGRESLPLHPIFAGAALGGLLWADPLGRQWSNIASAFYFAAAGGVSLVFWVILKGILKKQGIKVVLPGRSPLPPPPPPRGK